MDINIIHDIKASKQMENTHSSNLSYHVENYNIRSGKFNKMLKIRILYEISINNNS